MWFFFEQKTAYDVRISDWSSDVCSSDLKHHAQIFAILVNHPHLRRGDELIVTRTIFGRRRRQGAAGHWGTYSSISCRNYSDGSMILVNLLFFRPTDKGAPSPPSRLYRAPLPFGTSSHRPGFHIEWQDLLCKVGVPFF